MPSTDLNIFVPGRNCWKTVGADFVSIVVDYGNYYRDLHESIVKARHSIFILGWDIDSRIKLLRGEAAETSPYPNTLFDLLCWKAHENPHIQIYLNKWNYSAFFMRERESFWEHKWKSCGLPNIHICLDGMIPLGACHHQKIICIDDETVYWGGMDVALGRWDFRQHRVHNSHRADPCGLPHFEGTKPFLPYHDIQAVMAGPAAGQMAKLVRERWKLASDVEPLPQRYPSDASLPKTWPDTDPPDFENIEVSISRTVPAMAGQDAIREIEAVYLDEIAKAENFIYIENQFLCSDSIARAINRQLIAKPGLRVLAISCWEPQGIMERKAMWGGRVRFRDLIEENGVADRVVLAYPVSEECGERAVVRIHSKLMIIDDKWMHLGSSNINNRSMGMDTECDVIIIGMHEAARQKISAVRTDLIREHCGRPAEEIERMIEQGRYPSEFLKPMPYSTQFLARIDDEIYREEKFVSLARAVADPKQPFIPARWTNIFHHGKNRKKSQLKTVYLAGFLLLGGLLTVLWKYAGVSEYMSLEYLSSLFASHEESFLTYIWVIALYVVCSLLFVPVTILTAAVIVVFGGVKGVLLSFIAAMLSSAVGYQLGNRIGPDYLRHFSRLTETILNKISHMNVAGVAIIRNLPLAPFPVVNLVFGISNVSLLTFMTGTFIGLLPGKLTLAFLGDSISALIKSPSTENILYLSSIFTVWIVVMVACNKLAQHWNAKHTLKQA